MAVRLDAGEGASLVPELVALVAEDPLRERLRGHLMHALYRSGRILMRLRRIGSFGRCFETSLV